MEGKTYISLHMLFRLVGWKHLHFPTFGKIQLGLRSEMY